MNRRIFFKTVLNGMAVAFVMPSIDFTKEAIKVAVTAQDIKKARLLEPGWYKVSVDRITQRESRWGYNVLAVDMTTIDEGIPLTQYISERAPYPLLSLIKKCAIPEAAEVDITQCVGKEINVHIINKTHMGISNVVDA
jgi:hypothetical protein